MLPLVLECACYTCECEYFFIFKHAHVYNQRSLKNIYTDETSRELMGKEQDVQRTGWPNGYGKSKGHFPEG